MYKRVIKPLLFLFPPDFVHHTTWRCGRIVQAIPPVRWLLTRWWAYQDVRLEQELLGIRFKNPVGLSAGFDKNIGVTPLIESVGFGFEAGGSVTLAPRVGNPHPWFFRLPKTQSLVVHAGMANHGLTTIKKSIRRNERRLTHLPLFISIAVVAQQEDATIEDCVRDAISAARYIIEGQLAQGIEVNISCPNVANDEAFTYPEALDTLLAAFDTLSSPLPVFVKMPHLQDMDRFDALLQVIATHNVQGVTIANLVKERELVELKDTLPATVAGALSGAPTRAHSVELIRRAYRQHGDSLVIIGVGGVFSAEDAYEKIRAGASMVALVTGMIFEGPQVVGRINHGLVSLLERDGYSNIHDAIGTESTGEYEQH